MVCMNREKMHFFKFLLINDLNKLHTSARKAWKNISISEEDVRPSDPIDMASNALDQSIQLLLNDRERTLIEEIRDALARIDRGEYGICEYCGDHISEKRLMVKPTGRLCISCQEREENSYRKVKYSIF